MPILQNPGSSPTPSRRERVKTLHAEVQDTHPVLDNQAIMDESGVRATFLNNTSIDSDRFDNELTAVAGFPEGRIITVTYFSRNYPFLDVHTHVADINADMKDDVHLSWTQIRNFELRLPNEISIEYDKDSNLTNVSGEALVFAGFEPIINDAFFYKMRNGKIGVFLVTGLERTGIGHDTYHRITFSLNGWLDANTRTQFQRQSSTIVYFDKQKFITGNHALLSTEGYIQQNELKQLRKEIVQNYVDRFYDNTYSSFIRPDDIYDPYVVEYWNKKIGFTDCTIRPTQLLISMHGFTKTIWNVLTDGPIKLVQNIDKTYSIVTRAHRSMDTHFTSLIDKNYIAIGKDMQGVTATSNGTNVDATDESQDWNDPFIPYYEYNRYAGKLKSYHDKIWDKMRLRFYGDEFPFRQCPPSVHYTSDPHWAPEDCTKCGNKKCKFSQHKPEYVDHLGEHLKPPFPIRSSDELVTIWRRINRISETTTLTTDQEAQARGYILWYRETYPGTLSRKELEIEWREDASIEDARDLTEEEEAALIEYIKSYRSQYLPVLTDREIEIVWRTLHAAGYNTDLTDEQLVQVQDEIKRYRDLHGDVPDDGYDRPVVLLGRPLTAYEVEHAGAVMYDHPILGSMTLRDYHLAATGNSPVPTDPLPADYMPTIYIPQVRGYRYCPSMCSYLCDSKNYGSSSSKVTALSKTYALSPEFYLGSSAMSPFEKLVYDAITQKEINIQAVIETVKLYLTWSDEDAFYYHLFSIFLIDYALYWLKYHS